MATAYIFQITVISSNRSRLSGHIEPLVIFPFVRHFFLSVTDTVVFESALESIYSLLIILIILPGQPKCKQFHEVLTEYPQVNAISPPSKQTSDLRLKSRKWREMPTKYSLFHIMLVCSIQLFSLLLELPEDTSQRINPYNGQPTTMCG